MLMGLPRQGHRRRRHDVDRDRWRWVGAPPELNARVILDSLSRTWGTQKNPSWRLWAASSPTPSSDKDPKAPHHGQLC